MKGFDHLQVINNQIIGDQFTVESDTNNKDFITGKKLCTQRGAKYNKWDYCVDKARSFAKMRNNCYHK